MYAKPRILKETLLLSRDPPPGISGSPDPNNYRHFNILLEGPADTPYQGGIFKIELFLPEDYPLVPPKVRFLTKVYHPNIDKVGRICLDILKDNWSSALNIRTTLLSIQSLLCEPNLDDPLDTQVAEMFKNHIDEAKNTAREWTRLYAN